LSLKIDERKPVDILHDLNRAGNRQLPDKYITRKQAERESGGPAETFGPW